MLAKGFFFSISFSIAWLKSSMSLVQITGFSFRRLDNEIKCYSCASIPFLFRSLLFAVIQKKNISNGGKTYGDRFNSCQVIYSQFGLAIQELKPNDHQARRRFVEWAQNEIAVVPDFHKRILFSDEAHFWLNGYVNKQNCRIWSEANPQVYVETPLHP
ncbi:hypothetical protein TNCV_2865471 [Trichonephila clavipes]|nr:hypothetical protein TNCV_2865471 [Trichonephila clavipes]